MKNKIFKITMIFAMLMLFTPLIVSAALGGECGANGDNLTWTLDDNGTLTISGTGYMADYASVSDVPWYDNRAEIKTVIKNDGITSIGTRAFYECSFLENVTIPGSITSINMYSFSNCSNLTNVYITDLTAWCSINFDIGESLDANPLYYAKNLYINNVLTTDLIIPDGITAINDYSFFQFAGLTSLVISDGVTDIGKMVFCRCNNLNSVTIGDGVTRIGSSAFNECTGLKNVTIGNSVISIEGGAFCDCYDLTSITIPCSVTSIGSFAFSACVSLTDVYYGGSKDDWAKISIGGYNDKLTGANIHYTESCFTKPDTEGNEVSISAPVLSENVVSFTVELVSEHDITGNVFIAVYDDSGALTGIDVVDAAKLIETELTKTDSDSVIKVYWWYDTSIPFPMSAPEEIHLPTSESV